MRQPVVHILHGFNTDDGGAASIKRWAPLFRRAGFTVVTHNLGLIGLLDVRWSNKRLVERLAPLIKPGDHIVSFSNGTVIAHGLIQAGVKPASVVCVASALRRDAQWPDSLPVLNLASRKDHVLLLSRFWSRFVGRGHAWGSAGRHGFAPGTGARVANVFMDSSDWGHPVYTHSGAFEPPACGYWGEHGVQWCRGV